MRYPFRRVGLRAACIATAGVAACFLLAACGGSSTATPQPAMGTTAAAQLSVSGTAPPHAPETAATSAEQSATPASAAETSAAGAVTTGGSACSLVTEQDATVALGNDPGAGQPVTSQGASQCQYGTFQTALVLVNVTPTQGQAAYDRVRNDPKLASAGTAIDMPGLGDRAFGITAHGTGSIWINKGDTLVLVMVAKPLSADASQDSVLALAKTVSDRL